jgi:hypothetical protein
VIQDIQIIWIVDASGSIISSGNDQGLIYAINRVLDLLQYETDFEVARFHHSFLFFGSTEQWIDLSPGDLAGEFHWPDIGTSSSNLGAAFMSVGKWIQDKKPDKNTATILILMSDGFYTDDFKSALNKLNAISDVSFLRYSIAFSTDVNYEALLDFAANNPEYVIETNRMEGIFYKAINS